MHETIKPSWVVDIEDVKKSASLLGSKILNLLQKPDLVIDDLSGGYWLFWFKELVAFSLDSEAFHRIGEWDDELCVVNGSELPLTLQELDGYLQNSGSIEHIQTAYLNYKTESICLGKENN